MTVNPGWMLLPQADPCASAPTISSLGTASKISDGECDTLDGITIRNPYTLSGSVPAGFKLQYQYSWQQTNGAPSYGAWFDSGLTASSGNIDVEVGAGLYEVGGAAPQVEYGTFYWQMRARIVPTAGSPECDSLTGSQLSVLDVWGCQE